MVGQHAGAAWAEACVGKKTTSPTSQKNWPPTATKPPDETHAKTKVGIQKTPHETTTLVNFPFLLPLTTCV